MVGIIFTLSVAIPVTAVVTGYFTLKAYEMGIKHNFELKNNEKPSLKVEVAKKEISDVVDDKKENESFELFKEYTGM